MKKNIGAFAGLIMISFAASGCMGNSGKSEKSSRSSKKQSIAQKAEVSCRTVTYDNLQFGDWFGDSSNAEEVIQEGLNGWYGEGSNYCAAITGDADATVASFSLRSTYEYVSFDLPVVGSYIDLNCEVCSAQEETRAPEESASPDESVPAEEEVQY